MDSEIISIRLTKQGDRVLLALLLSPNARFGSASGERRGQDTAESRADR